MNKNSFLDNLKKDDYYINFENFKPFKINKISNKQFNSDEILVLESNNIIFEYWLKQNILIPPWQTHWFQLKDNFLLKLKEDLLEDLMQKAIKKSGNINKLSKILGMSFPTFYNFINKKQIKMVSIKKLKNLLNYLDISYNFINNKIEYTKKGNKISIENPKFPIDLSNIEGASLLGSIVSDGCIYIDKKARNKIRTKYSTNEEESIDKFIKYINKIFGKVHTSKENIRNCTIIRIGSSIIGESLLKVGAILGHKAKNNGNIPWLIKYGDINLKKAYLQSIFDDESSVYEGFPKYNSYIILSRYAHLKNLSDNQKEILEKLEEYMVNTKFPTGHINKTITIKRAIEFDKNLNSCLNSAPNLLSDESLILKEFGINNRLFGRSLTKTPLGNYSVCFNLFISQKESLKKFYKEIGFSLQHKQDKLKKIIGGIDGIKTI